MLITNPYLDNINNFKRTRIVEKFPELKLCSTHNYLSFFKYISSAPECFYNRNVFSLFYNWLQKQKTVENQKMYIYFVNETNKISNAIRCLNQINKLNIHDDNNTVGKDYYNLLEDIDEHIHPNYLKLIETVYSPLIRLIAFFSRINRNAKVDDMKIFNMVQEIQEQCKDMAIIIQPYHHIIRNGIAHGGITYLNREIRYTDNKGNSESFFDTDIIQFFDDMLDICNAMMLALKLFFIVNKENGYRFPLAFLIEELIAQSTNRYVEVNNCITMTIKNNVSQLLIYSFVKTTSFRRANFFMFHIASLAESLLPGFGRYFISIKSNCVFPGWFAFRGDKLALARLSPEKNYNIYADVIDEAGVFFQPRIKYPELFYKVDLYFSIIKTNYKFLIHNLKNIFQKVDICDVNTEVHRNGYHVVVNADAVLRALSEKGMIPYIKKNYKKIVAVILKKARKNDKRLSINQVLPLGFLRVNVYSEMARKRTFKRYGLRDKLICTLQFRRLSRISCPDIWGSIAEQLGLYRIMWNKEWLKERL